MEVAGPLGTPLGLATVTLEAARKCLESGECFRPGLASASRLSGVVLILPTPKRECGWSKIRVEMWLRNGAKGLIGQKGRKGSNGGEGPGEPRGH